MKTNAKKIIALVLTLVMALSLGITVASASENEMTIVVSLEGLTIGQGLYVAPTAYTLDEINSLVATKGYGPYTEATLTAAMATLAAFIDNDISLDGIIGWDGGLYISDIKGLDKGVINIPEAISAVSGITNEDNDGNDDDYLGAYDYSMYSGWMFLVNNEMAPVGAADFIFSRYETSYDNTWVVRWCYSIYGWGVDLGGDGWGMFPLIDGEFVNLDELYITYAQADEAEARSLADDVIQKYMPSSEEVSKAITDIRNYVPEEDIAPTSCSHICHKESKFLSLIWKIANFFNKLFNIKDTCVCGVAHY